MDKKQFRNPRPKFEIDYNNFSNSNQIQAFINKQLWTAGGMIQTNAGAQVDTSVKWGGQSRFLVGINFQCFNPFSHTLSLVINQEKIIDSANLSFFTPTAAAGNYKFQQYFEFIRPLSGSDTVVISLNSTLSEQVYYNFYMIREYNQYYVRA